jgi:hypothetical protein
MGAIWFGYTRPSKDYYSSNLTMNVFVISSLSSGKNYVYAYDERAMGKDCNALCSLRFAHHLRVQNDSNHSPRQSIDGERILYLVMDNCVGQNKSKILFMFYSFLSTPETLLYVELLLRLDQFLVHLFHMRMRMTMY